MNLRSVILWAGILCSSLAAQSTIDNLIFRNPNNQWDQCQGQITQLNFVSTVEGLFARTEMTVTVKDTVSTSWVDTLEAVMTFSLPSQSVIDSMYLWIDGKPEPAFMKKAWAATVIFENIVNRKQDPALLKKNGAGDSYTINIYPVKKRTARTFKICYTTPLQGNGNMLALRVPLALSVMSKFNVEAMSASVTLLGINSSSVTVAGCASDKVTITQIPHGKTLLPFSGTIDMNDPPVSVSGSALGTATKAQANSSKTLVSFADKNCKYFDPLEISMSNYAYANRGILVNFVRDSGQNWFFSARLNPEKMLGITQAASRKVLIMWNMVQLSQVQFDPGNNKYYYNFAYNYNWYIDQSKRELAAFIKQTLLPGDQLNLLINDGTVSSLFSELTPVTAQTLAGAERFLTDSISSTSIGFGCTTPLELLQKGVASMNKKDSVVIILIDNMQHGYYPGKYDTTLVRQQAEILTPGIAPHTTLYLTMVPGSPNIINAVYSRLTPLCASQILSVTASSSIQPSLQAMTTALAGKIYPFNLVLTSPSVRYPFDILGNESNNLEIRKSYLYTGRMTVSDKLTISLKGTYNGAYYSFDSTFSASDSSGYVTGISDFWAGRKVEQILAKQPTAFDNRQALNLSLQYRILSPQTALLALEKRIADSLKIKDDKPSTSDTLIIQQNNNNTTGINLQPGSVNFTTTLFVHQAGSQVTMRLPLGAIAGADPAAKKLEVKIFDLRGKCIADLSHLPMNAGGRIVFSTKNLAKGFYCVRIKIGSMLFMRNFSIVN